MAPNTDRARSIAHSIATKKASKPTHYVSRPPGSGRNTARAAGRPGRATAPPDPLARKMVRRLPGLCAKPTGYTVACALLPFRFLGALQSTHSGVIAFR